MISIQSAFNLINVLDVSEKKRKYFYNYSEVLVSFTGEIVAVYRYKNIPSSEERRRIMLLHPKTYNFTATPGMYKSPGDLKNKIKSDIIAFKKLKGFDKQRRLKNIRSLLLFPDGEVKAFFSEDKDEQTRAYQQIIKKYAAKLFKNASSPDLGGKVVYLPSYIELVRGIQNNMFEKLKLKPATVMTVKDVEVRNKKEKFILVEENDHKFKLTDLIPASLVDMEDVRAVQEIYVFKTIEKELE